jgi:hypothetical protein
MQSIPLSIQKGRSSLMFPSQSTMIHLTPLSLRKEVIFLYLGTIHSLTIVGEMSDP